MYIKSNLAFYSGEINLRAFVYAYTYQFSDVSKADIARRLGISQMALSRAIVFGKKVKMKDMNEIELFQMMKELDYDELKDQLDVLDGMARIQNRMEYQTTVVPIISDYVAREYTEDTWVVGADNNFSMRKLILTMRSSKMKQWNFIAIDSNADVEKAIEWANLQRSYARRITLVTDNEELFFQCTGDEAMALLGRDRIGLFASVLFLNRETENVEREIVLADPDRVI